MPRQHKEQGIPRLQIGPASPSVWWLWVTSSRTKSQRGMRSDNGTIPHCRFIPGPQLILAFTRRFLVGDCASCGRPTCTLFQAIISRPVAPVLYVLRFILLELRNARMPLILALNIGQTGDCVVARLVVRISKPLHQQRERRG